MRKQISVLAAAGILSAVMMTGCSSEPAETTAAATAATTAEETTAEETVEAPAETTEAPQTFDMGVIAAALAAVMSAAAGAVAFSRKKNAR